MKNQKVNEENRNDPLGYESSEAGDTSDDEESLFSSEESSNNEDEENDMEEGSDFNESEGAKSADLFESGSEATEPVSEAEDESDSPPDLYHSLLYAQRIKSFQEGGWPIVKTGTSDKCTPHELAMAGLEFAAQGGAKCVICYRHVTGLSRNSDPWEAHQQTNSKCPLIKLGKPTRPDGYSLQNFFKLIGEKQALFLEYQLLLFEDQVKGMLKGLVAQENEGQAQTAGV